MYMNLERPVGTRYTNTQLYIEQKCGTKMSQEIKYPLERGKDEICRNNYSRYRLFLHR